MADLYEVLGISPSATDSEIKQAYRRRSLETHPDRYAVGSKEQKEAVVRFQEVNNAYYVLSDSERRRDYDSKRSSGSNARNRSGSWFGSGSPTDSGARANEQFGSVFEEMMAEEGLNEANQTRFYGVSGGAAGAVLGFIFANVPGALAGAVGGYKLGRVRDTKGKAVYEVFQELPHAEKARLISALLSKVMVQLS